MMNWCTKRTIRGHRREEKGYGRSARVPTPRSEGDKEQGLYGSYPRELTVFDNWLKKGIGLTSGGI